MPVEEDHRFARRPRPLARDERGPVRLDHARRQPGLPEQRRFERGALANADVLGADARLREEPEQTGEEGVLMRMHMRAYGGQACFQGG